MRASNILYAFTARAAAKLDGLGIAWSIENPSNSIMWLTSWFQELRARKYDAKDSTHYDRVSFHMCMHGGRRPKKTDFIYGGGLDLSHLQKECDGNHDHLPWGLSKEPGEIFASALERNYPQLLARRVARSAAKRCKAKQVEKHLTSKDKEENLEMQPRRTASEVVAEFKEVETILDVTKEETLELKKWNEGGYKYY